MAQNDINGGQFTLGPNNSVAIYDSNGEVDWGILTTISWDSQPVQERRQISLMSGFRYELIFNEGWKGGLDIQRTKGSLDAYWANLEALVRAGLPYPRFTIIQTIQETDGSTSRYTFSGAAITYEDAGKYTNEEGVVQRLMFTSPVRLVEVTASGG